MDLQTLVIECKLKKRIAQQSLFDSLSERMFLVCRRYVNDDSVAQELVSTGFLKFFLTIHRFNYINDKATIGWLREIMVKECLMYLRPKKKIRTVPKLDERIVEENLDVIGDLSAKEILKAITLLPEDLRIVFNLALEGYSHADISKFLGITNIASRIRLHRAKEILEQTLIINNEDYESRSKR